MSLKERIKDLKKYVIGEFGSDITQKHYIKKSGDGLWKAEEILIKKYFKPKSKILDIGCGTGRTTIPLYKAKYDIIGIDITPEMIANAKKIAKSQKLKIKYDVEDATQMKFDDESFDNAIFSNNGWTQIPGSENRVKALNEVRRVLKREGCYIFTAHVKKIKGFTFFWIKQWIRFYIIKKLGFHIDEQDFGDRFFARENSGVEYKQKQYIHIPSVNYVKKQLMNAGFDLIYNAQGNVIDGTKNYQPMYYVCKKR